MYGTETKNLKRAVKNNMKRFPSDFMFELTKEECLRSQIVILNAGQGKHLKYMPYAFSEMGVAMLSSMLRSNTAIQVNINIMRAFTSLRQLIANPPPDKHSLLQKEVKELKEYIEEMFSDQNDINEDTRVQLELKTNNTPNNAHRSVLSGRRNSLPQTQSSSFISPTTSYHSRLRQ